MAKPLIRYFQLIFRTDDEFKLYVKFRKKCLENNIPATKAIKKFMRLYAEGKIKL